VRFYYYINLLAVCSHPRAAVVQIRLATQPETAGISDFFQSDISTFNYECKARERLNYYAFLSEETVKTRQHNRVVACINATDIVCGRKRTAATTGKEHAPMRRKRFSVALPTVSLPWHRKSMMVVRRRCALRNTLDLRTATTIMLEKTVVFESLGRGVQRSP
jgi:hypothetical protein